jgi:hypothetical protein
LQPGKSGSLQGRAATAAVVAAAAAAAVAAAPAAAAASLHIACPDAASSDSLCGGAAPDTYQSGNSKAAVGLHVCAPLAAPAPDVASRVKAVPARPPRLACPPLPKVCLKGTLFTPLSHKNTSTQSLNVQVGAQQPQGLSLSYARGDRDHTQPRQPLGGPPEAFRCHPGTRAHEPSRAWRTAEKRPRTPSSAGRRATRVPPAAASLHIPGAARSRHTSRLPSCHPAQRLATPRATCLPPLLLLLPLPSAARSTSLLVQLPLHPSPSPLVPLAPPETPVDLRHTQQPPTHALIQTHMHTQKCTHKQTHIHMHTHTYAYTHTHTHKHWPLQIHMHTLHTRTHTHTYTCARTHLPPQLRKDLDLVVNLVHGFSIPGLKTRHEDLDIVVIRCARSPGITPVLFWHLETSTLGVAPRDGRRVHLKGGPLPGRPRPAPCAAADGALSRPAAVLAPCRPSVRAPSLRVLR